MKMRGAASKCCSPPASNSRASRRLQAQRTLHRVRVGPFASVEEFDLTMKRLRELGINDARLLTE